MGIQGKALRVPAHVDEECSLFCFEWCDECLPWFFIFDAIAQQDGFIEAKDPFGGDVGEAVFAYSCDVELCEWVGVGGV